MPPMFRMPDGIRNKPTLRSAEVPIRWRSGCLTATGRVDAAKH